MEKHSLPPRLCYCRAPRPAGAETKDQSRSVCPCGGSTESTPPAQLVCLLLSVAEFKLMYLKRILVGNLSKTSSRCLIRELLLSTTQRTSLNIHTVGQNSELHN